MSRLIISCILATCVVGCLRQTLINIWTQAQLLSFKQSAIKDLKADTRFHDSDSHIEDDALHICMEVTAWQHDHLFVHPRENKNCGHCRDSTVKCMRMAWLFDRHSEIIVEISAPRQQEIQIILLEAIACFDTSYAGLMRALLKDENHHT